MRLEHPGRASNRHPGMEIQKVDEKVRENQTKRVEDSGYMTEPDQVIISKLTGEASPTYMDKEGCVIGIAKVRSRRIGKFTAYCEKCGLALADFDTVGICPRCTIVEEKNDGKEEAAEDSGSVAGCESSESEGHVDSPGQGSGTEDSQNLGGSEAVERGADPPEHSG